MFSPVPMQQITAVVLERDERVVLRELGRLGVLQLTRTGAGPDTAPLPPRDRREEMARCDRLLIRVEALRKSLEIVAFAEELKPVEMTVSQAEEALRLMEARAGVLLQRRQLLLQTLSESTAVAEKVSSYRGLDLPLDQAEQFSFLHFVTGNLPAENLAALQRDIADNVALLPLPKKHGQQPLFAMTTNQGRFALDATLKRMGFQPERLPVIEGATTDSFSEASQREQTKTTAALDKLKAEQQALAAEFARPLAAIESLANIERQLLEAEQHFPRTTAAVLVAGWAPADEAPGLAQRVRQITHGRCAIEIAHPARASTESIPVLLRPPRLLRPFKMLLSAYGLPKYHELEPTLFVAISYLLMFGIMFGDAGHGAVLAAGGGLAWFAGRTEKVRDGGLLIFFAGISSILFGIVYGSCFGLESFRKFALWRDPLAGDPITLMYGAIGIGILMISLGLVLNIINCFRHGDVLGGFLDKFGVAGLIFYWGALALITKYAALQSRGLVHLTVFLFLILPLAGWALKKPIEYFLDRRAGRPVAPGDGLFAMLLESLLGAFEAVLGYLANTISFARLAAYAMSHAALLVAAFGMAEELKHFPLGGGGLSVLVIILGNLIAIVLEGIIAAVQALRLEYYEFFGKFFPGTGQPFRPFRLGADNLSWKGALS